MTSRFSEVGREVYVLRYPVLDVNVALVVGADRVLVVDTLSTDAQATELRSAVREVTPLPLCVVNTHHHFDHWFGNGVVAGPDTDMWAHEETIARLRRRLEEQRAAWVAEWAPVDAQLAAGMATATLRPPDRTVHLESTVDLGGRTVVLRHLGRGHTDGDLVVLVPDAGVVLAGDLVEEGGPPMFGDGYPLEWAETLGALLRLTSPATSVVPGHGAVVDADFVRTGHDQMTALAWLIRDGHADGAPVAAVAAKAPFDTETALVAVRRGYAELSGST
jgi:glyoxylase-like metal-dependent hydrolase (beta-lactamase superfamily II)